MCRINNTRLPNVNPSAGPAPVRRPASSAKPVQQTAPPQNTRVADNTAVRRNVNRQSELPANTRSFPTPGVSQSSGNSPVTRDTLIRALRNSSIGSAYEANKAKMDNIADTAIRVGQQEGIDPRILFAMAMQESRCGTDTRHSGGADRARGVMGIKPSSAGAAGMRGANLEDTTTNITASARYLKVVAREARVSPSSLNSANLGSDTWKILLSYRHGAGTIRNHGTANRSYENVGPYLRSMGVNIAPR